jgi:hypothetical protein
MRPNPVKSGPGKTRRLIGMAAFAAALIFAGWLLLGILGVLPLLFHLPGESALRSHAGAAVFLLLVAAWAFWET